MKRNVFLKTVFMVFFQVSAVFALTVETRLEPAADFEIPAGAVDAVRLAMREKYALAAKKAEQSGLPLASDIVQWIRLTNAKTIFGESEAKEFIKTHEDWPRLYLIRRNTEKVLLKTASKEELRDWFEKYPPVCSAAVLAYAEILFREQNWEKAVPMIHNLWVKGDLTDEERTEIQEKYGALLDERDYASRLHRLLWARQTKEAEELINHVDGEMKKIFQARLALIKNKDASEDMERIKNQNDTGVVFDTIRRLRRNNRYDEAAALLGHKNAGKVEPSLWWAERATIARTYLTRKKFKQAYRLVQDHRLEKGEDYADAEWLAGWISLRFLKNKKKAVAHFSNMLEVVSSPVSVARGEYWLGRTHEELGRQSEAAVWYKKAAQQLTTLYGQLASAKLRRQHIPDLPVQADFSAETAQKIRTNELFKAVLLLQKAKEVELAEPFAFRLYGLTVSAEEVTALAYLLANEANRPDLAVSIARRARQNGVYFIGLSYPMREIANKEVERALALAIIRQESSFATHVVSSAGARGLMQIMPATAKDVMRLKKLKPQKLNNAPDWNIEVGTKYVQSLLNRFNGSYVMAIAAYNAGPGNVSRWIKTFGKPEEGFLDTIDWIEMIPFSETRNYVLRVLENLYVYRRLSGYPSEMLTEWRFVDVTRFQALND